MRFRRAGYLAPDRPRNAPGGATCLFYRVSRTLVFDLDTIHASCPAAGGKINRDRRGLAFVGWRTQ